MTDQIRQHLNEIQTVMQKHHLWEAVPPAEEDLASNEPFCVSTLSAPQWLQWIFIPRMSALLEANGDLPRNFAITPYLEEALKNEIYLAELYSPILKLETLLKTV